MVQTSIYERHSAHLYDWPACHRRAAMGLGKLSFPNHWSMMARMTVLMAGLLRADFSAAATHGSLVPAAYSSMFPVLTNRHFRNKMNGGEHDYH